MSNQLEQIRKYSVIVTDTADFNVIKKYSPTDATTNPSLILKVADKPEYQNLIEDAVKYAKDNSNNESEAILLALDKSYVNFGCEILKMIPGRVSTEVDARLSFSTEGSIEKARSIIKLYEKMGINKNRILIKLASTWEGIRACEILEKEGIHCNMTLMFSLTQAIAAAEAGATIMSPFVGRILDWHKKATGKEFSADLDPGVLRLSEIYYYLKHFDYKTKVMSASFRNVSQILQLVGCDLLTISPVLLEKLTQSTDPVHVKLTAEKAKELEIKPLSLNQSTFRFMLNEDAMATEKLSEGIRIFSDDSKKLEDVICSKIRTNK